MLNLMTNKFAQSFLLGTVMAKSRGVDVSKIMPQAMMASMIPDQMMGLFILKKAVDDAADSAPAAPAATEVAPATLEKKLVVAQNRRENK